MIDKLNLVNVEKPIMITDNNYYLDTTHVSNSMLSVLNDKGPKGLQEFNNNIYARSMADYFVFGEAVHKAILEPDKFDKEYIYISKKMYPFPDATLRKKENKEFLEDFKLKNEKKTILTEADYDKVITMKNAFFQLKECRDLIKDCEVEKIYTGEWKNGVKIKCKIDAVKEGSHIMDIKTTVNSHPNSFKDKCQDFGYLRQAAMYTHLAGVKEFTIVAIDKNPPHTVGIYTVTEDSLIKAGLELNSLINEYKKYFIDNTDAIDDFCYMSWL